jgi:hypothetical protein
MKVSVRNVYKKIEKAGGKIGADGTAAARATPTTASKKRKTPQKKVDTPNDADDDEPETPAPKKRGPGRPKRATPAKKTASVKDEVKNEDVEDDE